MFARSICADVLYAAAGTAAAQAPAAPSDPYVGSVALGYLGTSGNTDSTNFNAALKVTWDLDGPWEPEWTALAINARTDDETTAQAEAAGYKAQHNFGEISYIFFFSRDGCRIASRAATGGSRRPPATATA